MPDPNKQNPDLGKPLPDDHDPNRQGGPDRPNPNLPNPNMPPQHPGGPQIQNPNQPQPTKPGEEPRR